MSRGRHRRASRWAVAAALAMVVMGELGPGPQRAVVERLLMRNGGML